MQIDTAIFTGTWPFRRLPKEGIAAILEQMNRYGTDFAFVSDLEAPLHVHPGLSNQRLHSLCARTSALVPVYTLRPNPDDYPSGLSPLDQLPHSVDQLSLRAIRLYPGYHGYGLDDPALQRLCDSLFEAAIVPIIQVRLEDERAQNPRFPIEAPPLEALQAFAGHYSDHAMLFAGLYYAELPSIAPFENIHVEISHVETLESVGAAVDILGKERVLLGTHFPLHSMGPAIAKLEDYRRIAPYGDIIGGGNAQRLFGFSC